MMRNVPLVMALTDPRFPVGEMVHVTAESVPSWLRRDFKAARTARGWAEAYQPTNQYGEGQCKFGCKVYVRRRGAVREFAVFHSLTYGHSHSPNVR